MSLIDAEDRDINPSPLPMGSTKSIVQLTLDIRWLLVWSQPPSFPLQAASFTLLQVSVESISSSTPLCRNPLFFYGAWPRQIHFCFSSLASDTWFCTWSVLHMSFSAPLGSLDGWFHILSIFFILFFCHTHRMQNFLGQELNRHHSSDQAGSLTH